MWTWKASLAPRPWTVLLVGMLSSYLGSGQLWSQTKGSSYGLVRLAVPGAATASTESRDLNDKGNVVGTYRDANGVQHGYHFDHATKTYRSLGAGITVAGISLSDKLAGTDDVVHWALYWSSPTAAPTPLLPLPGHTHSRADAINDAGVVVGSSYIPEESPLTPGFRAIVVWHVEAGGAVSAPLVLPYPAGDLRGSAADVTEQKNGVTVVVGSTGDANTFPGSAVEWSVIGDETGTQWLLTGPTELGGDYAEATGINAWGDVVGQAVFAQGASGWPFLKPAGQPLVPLAGISKATTGFATAINDLDQIVGGQMYLSRTAGVVQRAVLWSTPSTVIDLNSKIRLGASETLTWATRINSRGDILGRINGSTPCLLIAK